MRDYLLKYPYAEIRSQDGLSHFKIYTYGYAFPLHEAGYDSDWQKNYLYLTIPAFKAEVDDVMLQGKLMKSYLAALEKFSKLEIEEAIFEPLEQNFRLIFLLNTFKKVIVKGYIQYPVGWGAELIFEFETDLTYVDTFLGGIKNILYHYPPR